MNKYFTSDLNTRREIIKQVANRIGLPMYAVEKDLWVTTTLQILFSLPIAEMLVFKGGTSLSKVWGLIERFSEDIDLALDRSQFGINGDLTKKQLKKLRKESSLFVKGAFVESLEAAFEDYGLDGMCKIVPEDDGTGDNTYPEPRKVYVYFNSVFADTDSYLQDRIVIEVGARSLMEPTERHQVTSLVNTTLDIDTDIAMVEIITAVPEKTFLEKAFLLHELFSTSGGHRADRRSRHLYDLERMMDKPFAVKAIHDDELWNSILHHREVYTPIRGVDYKADIRSNIQLTPPDDVRTHWEEDYEKMRASMIYGDALPFDKLIQRISLLANRFSESSSPKNIIP